MDLTLAPAVDQAAAVASREVSATELLEATLDRYERFNPTVNAVVVTRIDEARRRAGALDDELARGATRGPLHGVPMTVKEAFDWVGTPSTWGDPALAGNVPTVNATAVDRLLDAGAVIYGKTNVPLGLSDWQSFNEVYGTTNNPWDLSRAPGGSSGGAAAALATGMAALELGSDIGASIRNPAHYCGVFGHKPTFDVVPLAGHAHPGCIAPVDIGVGGPMARSAADLDLGLSVLAGPDHPASVGYSLSLPERAGRDLADFRVAVMLESPVLVQDGELTARLTEAVEALAAAGVQVDWEARPAVDQHRAHENYLTLLRAATGPFLDDDAYAAQTAPLDRYRAGERDYAAQVAHGVCISHRDWWHATNEREHLRVRWAEFFQRHDLLLCPTAASAAFPHDHEGVRADRTIPVDGGRQPTTDQLFWAGWSCNVYLPATVAPVGLTASGLPCGLQIVAPHLHDRRSIAFAALVERELGGFVPPPGYE